MGCGDCINKMFLVALNLVVFLVGGLVVALASVVIHKTGDFKVLLGDGVVTVPIILLIVGICITLLGFFGCCGAMQENSCMLYTYATVVLIFFIAEIVLAVLILVYPMKAEEGIKEGMKEVLPKYYEKEDPLITRSIDLLQHDSKCCGIDGPADWIALGHKLLPTSCCNISSNITCTVSNAYQTGCFIVIRDSVTGVLWGLGIAALVLAIIQIASICIACGLAKKQSY